MNVSTVAQPCHKLICTLNIFTLLYLHIVPSLDALANIDNLITHSVKSPDLVKGRGGLSPNKNNGDSEKRNLIIVFKLPEAPHYQ